MIKRTIWLIDKLIGFDQCKMRRNMPLGEVKMKFRDPRIMIMQIEKVYGRFLNLG